MADLSDAYHASRRRIGALVSGLEAAALATRVPACPAWNVRDLVAHVSGVPDAIAAGDLPVEELLDRWAACAGATSALVDGGVERILVDVVCHEHDLRGAIGRPGERGAPEVRAIVQAQLDALVPAMKERGVGALVVDAEAVQWASHLAKPGCTLRIDPWEATRVLESRRTADEIRALPHRGDVEPYVEIIAEHLPLPTAPLGER